MCYNADAVSTQTSTPAPSTISADIEDYVDGTDEAEPPEHRLLSDGPHNAVIRKMASMVLAHFFAGYDNPWAINTNKFVSILQEIWDVIYEEKIEHTVTSNGAVFHMVCRLILTVHWLT